MNKYLLLAVLLFSSCKKQQATIDPIEFVKIGNGTAILQTTFNDDFILTTDFDSKDGDVMAKCDPKNKYKCYCDSGEVAIYQSGKIFKQGRSIVYP